VAVIKTDTFEPNAQVDEHDPDIAFSVQKADGKKCERCWNFSESVGGNSSYAMLCDQCVAAIQGGK